MRQELTAQLLGTSTRPGPGSRPPRRSSPSSSPPRAEAQQTAVQLAVYRTVAAAGADPDALLGSRAFADSLADVDPADSAAVTAAITANPVSSSSPPWGPRPLSVGQ
ncbi:hypothetical protein [Streptomyces sp. NPDC001903]|uniref:hypothetical protein n=1 Tax=Streptomyces sp. NPDC001903 TaxID=3364622 RepID=UPI0036BFAFD1